MQENTYKVIAIQKKHPIFICKAVPVNQPVQPQTGPRQPNLFFFKQEFQRTTHKYSTPRLKHNSPSPLTSPKRLDYMSNRSSSCNLPKQGPKQLLNLFEGKPAGGVSEGEVKGKQMRSIKEYLRLAYKRNERDRRVYRIKLPEIRKQEPRPEAKEEEQELSRNSSDLQYMANMKHVLRRGVRKERLPVVPQAPAPIEDASMFRVESLSGWQDGNPQDFQN